MGLATKKPLAAPAGALSVHHEGPSQKAMEEKCENGAQATFSTVLPMKPEAGRIRVRWRCGVKEFSLKIVGRSFFGRSVG